MYLKLYHKIVQKPPKSYLVFEVVFATYVEHLEHLTQSPFKMCAVTYIGISTRKSDFNSYVENITRARCAHLKSPKRVESP